MRVGGIDPGKRGAVAVLTGDGKLETAPLSAVDNPKSWLTDRGVTICYVEKAQAMPRQGVVSMFNYGLGFGRLLGLLEDSPIKVHLVAPGTWTRRLHPEASGASPKAKSLFLARRLWPEHNWIPRGCRTIHDGLIDAAMLALFGLFNEADYRGAVIHGRGPGLPQCR